MSRDEHTMMSHLGVVTGVHPEVERLYVTRLPVVAVDLVEPAHDVPLELGLVLDGRHPAIGPGGSHILTHRVSLFKQEMALFYILRSS